jgi:hypothetical protein
MFTSIAVSGEGESAPRLRIVGGDEQASQDLHDVPAFLSRA